MSSPSGQMKQCLLQQGELRIIAWIPAKFAIPNKYVQLKGDGGFWSDGWLVVEAWGTRFSESEVRENQRVDLPSIR